MFRTFTSLLVALLLFPSLLHAQRIRDEEGFELGSLIIRPVAEAEGKYDNRVATDAATGDVDGDVYGEVSAAVYMENKPARYDFSAYAGYGYRFYNEYGVLDDDFYKAGLALGSEEQPLRLGLSSDVKKTLDYDVLYETDPGGEPGEILTDDPSTRYTTRASVAYEAGVSDKTSIIPGYDFWHYFQDFTDEVDAEWLVHRASLQVGYDYTERTRFFLTGVYSLQVNEEEDGSIGSVLVGGEGRITDKTRWLAHLGVAAADYEKSGADQGVVGLLRANWQATDKVSAYVYGSSRFQPGHNSAARRVYRLGYGADWNIFERWLLAGQILHDYQEELGGGGGDDDVRNFIVLRSEYALMRSLMLTAGLRYIMDEEDEDQVIASAGLLYRY